MDSTTVYLDFPTAFNPFRKGIYQYTFNALYIDKVCNM